MILPDEIYRKILLYNIHNNAEILKVFIKAYNDDMSKYSYNVVDFAEWYDVKYCMNKRLYREFMRDIREIQDE